MDKKIFDKIEKLLNLSKSSNEHEAALALQRAQKLMATYNISVEDVKGSKISSGSVDEIVNAELIEVWVDALLSLVTSTFGIKAVRHHIVSSEFNKNGKNVLYFIGDTNRVNLATYCYEVLARQLKTARKNFNKSLPADTKNKWRLADSFCFGWVNAIRKKVSALVITDDENILIENKMKTLFPNTRDGKTHENAKVDNLSYMMGVEKGKDVSLNVPVSGSSAQILGVGYNG